MDEILKQIREEHIIYAIEQLDKNRWGKKNNSSKFDLVHNGKTYPPKMIIRHAGIKATGEEPVKFGGGKESNELLMKFGFTVVDKETGLPIGKKQRSVEDLRDRQLEQELKNESQNIERILGSADLSATEKKELVKIRIGQGAFRKYLLAVHTSCELCNVNNPLLLIASHIKPWKDCHSEERLDRDNGLLLCPNHDSLFDKGLITFDGVGQIIISTDLSSTDRIFMNVLESMKIMCTNKRRKYMNWHQTHVYKM